MGGFNAPQRRGFGDEQLRVPKKPVRVSVTLDGGTVVVGNVHLALDAGWHEGRERVIDLLNAPEPFMPVTALEGSRLVMKDRIVTVDFESAFDAGLDEGSEGAVAARVAVHLAGLPSTVATLEGRLRLVMPPGRERVLDFLNEAGAFFPLELDAGVALVARRYILEVSQAE
ncbi:MAG TPA: hypothetical protein PKG80_04515 [Acidobacteriota bacterium]|nr:hypothetical protein [bacterium]HNX19514.1 hypothetical protein [Acidobacteriota bacterium]